MLTLQFPVASFDPNVYVHVLWLHKLCPIIGLFSGNDIWRWNIITGGNWNATLHFHGRNDPNVMDTSLHIMSYNIGLFLENIALEL